MDEALNASLLLYVVDSADPSFRSQLEVTQTVLREVGVIDIPYFLVLNKRDKISDEESAAITLEFPDAISISTRSPEDLERLREKILAKFESSMVDEEVLVPYNVQGAIGEIRSRVRVLKEEYDAEGVRLLLRATPEDLARLRGRFELK